MSFFIRVRSPVDDFGLTVHTVLHIALRESFLRPLTLWSFLRLALGHADTKTFGTPSEDELVEIFSSKATGFRLGFSVGVKEFLQLGSPVHRRCGARAVDKHGYSDVAPLRFGVVQSAVVVGSKGRADVLFVPLQNLFVSVALLHQVKAPLPLTLQPRLGLVAVCENGQGDVLQPWPIDGYIHVGSCMVAGRTTRGLLVSKRRHSNLLQDRTTVVPAHQRSSQVSEAVIRTRWASFRANQVIFLKEEHCSSKTKLFKAPTEAVYL